MSEKIQPQHLARKAMLYMRQSSAFQVAHNQESGKLQYAMQARLRACTTFQRSTQLLVLCMMRGDFQEPANGAWSSGAHLAPRVSGGERKQVLWNELFRARLRDLRRNLEPGDKPDIVPRKPSAAKIECIARLSRNRVAGPRGDGVFVLERFRGAGSESEAVWLTYMRSFTKLSHCSGMEDRTYARDCKGHDCESDTRRRVKWTAVERCVREWTKSAE